METSLGSQGHPDPSPHPQLSLYPPQLHQAEVPEQWHASATTDGDTEAEEGPGPRSQTRRHPCGLVLGTGLPHCHHHLHGPHHSPNSSAFNPTPKSPAQGSGSILSTAPSCPSPSQAHPARGAASAAPLATTALLFAAGMLARGRGLGCRRCRGCRQQGERGKDNPQPQQGEAWGSQHP